MDRRDTQRYERGTQETPVLPRMQSRYGQWNFRPDSGWSAAADLTGYHVKATDGNIGKIELTSHATDESYIVVDTGPWIFGTKVVVPAGTVAHIDHRDRMVYLDAPKDMVRSAPAYVPSAGREANDSELKRDYGQQFH